MFIFVENQLVISTTSDSEHYFLLLLILLLLLHITALCSVVVTDTTANVFVKL